MEKIKLPTRAEIEALKVGDQAPDCFGRMAKVTDILYRGIDTKDRYFVGYYTKHGDNGKISMSMKEGCIARTVGFTVRYTSAQIDALERTLQKEQGFYA